MPALPCHREVTRAANHCREVDDLLAVLEESLRARPARIVAAFDSPGPIRPRLGVLAFRAIAGSVGVNRPEPSSWSHSSTTSMVAQGIVVSLTERID
jgi:hypothetical protein